MKRKYILIGALSCFILLYLLSTISIFYRHNRTIYIQDIKQYTRNINVIKEKINGGVIALEINIEELFAINDLKEN